MARYSGERTIIPTAEAMMSSVRFNIQSLFFYVEHFLVVASYAAIYNLLEQKPHNNIDTYDDVDIDIQYR